MPEIGSSGLMSGDGKRGVGHRPQATAPILDSTVADLGEDLDFGYPAALQKPRLCAEAPFANPLRAGSGVHRFEELGTRLHLSNRTWQDHLICLGGLTASSHTV